jgi:hypothetical protein
VDIFFFFDEREDIWMVLIYGGLEGTGMFDLAVEKEIATLS